MLKKSKNPVRHFDAGDYIVGSIGSENDPVGLGSADIDPINLGNMTINPASDPNMNPNVLGDANSPFKRGDVFVNQTPIDASSGIAGLKKFVTDNKSFLAGAGALASAYGGGTNADKKTGYQGVIPTLAASRSMIAAPPTRAQGYRPGAGGIDYGGDVSYTLAPGMDPYANLSGTSGSAAGANLTTPGSSIVTPAGTTVTPGSTTVTPGGTKVVTPITTTPGGTKTTVVGGTDTTKTNVASKGYQDALKAGLTPTQYYGNINQWLVDNPRASRAQIDAIMAQVGVSKEDLQKALGTSNFSDFTKYGLVNDGKGLQELNFAISNWVEKNPYATAQEIKDIMKASGATQEDIGRGLNALSASAGKEAAVVGGMGLDQLYKNILDYQSKPRTPEEIAAALAATGLEQRDLNAAQKYAKDKGYVGNPKSEAANFDYLANTKAADTSTKNTSVANTSAVNTSLADTLAAVNSNAGTSAVDVPTSNAVADVASVVSNTTPAASAPTSYYDEGAGMEMLYPTTVANNVSSTPAAIADVVQAASTPTVVQDTTPDNSGKLSEIYQYFAMPETQAALASGDTRSIAETMQALGYSPAEVAQATGSNPAEVQAAYDAALGIGKEDTSYMQYAEGGEIAMAKGRYLQGETDGMADKLPARIGRDQPAALSHGEFVIPADVVSHMGNGNSDAGAKKLYQMMDKIRMARTGNKKQGKKINPDKFMPGGLAQAYAAGGQIQHFQEGGAAKNYAAGLTGVESNLSNWAGPYVTNMLGQGQALANMPYQAYMGQLSGGESPLQASAFSNAAGLETPSSIGTAATSAGTIGTKAQGLAYSPTTFDNQYTAPGAYSPTTSAFDATQAQAYMNPYLQASLNPQLDEARRQSQITQAQNASKMTQAGAFGGGRQAILDAETQRSLGSNLANITGQGYNTAYGNAMSQFNADQQRKMQEAQFGSGQGMANAQLRAQYGLAGQQAGEQSKQFGAGFGLQGLQTGLQAAQAQGSLGVQQNQADINNLNAQLTAGAQQRGIESEGIAADKAQFEEARANPYKMVQYQQSLLQGLPLAAQSYQGISPSALTQAAQGASTVNALLKNLGLA
jgi:hypothetical protein